MQWIKNNLLLVGFTLGVCLILSGILLTNLPQNKPPTVADNFNHISDSSIGLSFNMSKTFEPISRDELAAMNPGFTYGFKPADDVHASCIISNIKLTASGAVTPEQLRDGLMKEIKKVHPDVKLINPETALNAVKFGDAKGILLQMTYQEGESIIRRVETITLGKTTQVIAYCQSLSKDSARYYNDFTTFFSSLKLTK